jgi:phospholipase C
MSEASGEQKEVVATPTLTSITLNVRIPKGKFSDFYRGVLSVLEDSFEDTEVYVKIEAKKGKIPKPDYENKVKETLIQINAQIVEEETRE